MGEHYKTPQQCAHGCGKPFIWPPAKHRHEQSCKRTTQMAQALEAHDSTLRAELLGWLDKKRMPLVAQLAEIDSLIRSLKVHIP